MTPQQTNPYRQQLLGQRATLLEQISLKKRSWQAAAFGPNSVSGKELRRVQPGIP